MDLGSAPARSADDARHLAGGLGREHQQHRRRDAYQPTHGFAALARSGQAPRDPRQRQQSRANEPLCAVAPSFAARALEMLTGIEMETQRGSETARLKVRDVEPVVRPQLAATGFYLFIDEGFDGTVAEAIEDALRAFRLHLRDRVRSLRLRLSPRLGPGYLDWPLEEQARLFGLFAGESIPVTLSEYCVMTPKKSISGLFGLLPHH